MNTKHITGSKTNMNSISKKQAPAEVGLQWNRLERIQKGNAPAVLPYDFNARIKDEAHVLADVFGCGACIDTDEYCGNKLRETESVFLMLEHYLIRVCQLPDDMDEHLEWFFSAEDFAWALGLRGCKEALLNTLAADQWRLVLFGENNEPMEVISTSGLFVALLKYSQHTEAGQRFMRWATRTLLPILFDGHAYDMESAYEVCDKVYPEIVNA